MGSRKNSGQKKTGTSIQNKDVTLIMECETEPLSEAQLEYKNKIEEEYNQFIKKLEEGITKRGGEIIEQGTHITIYEIDCVPNFPPPLVQDIAVAATPSPGLIKATPTSSLLATTQSSNPPPLIPNNGVLIQSSGVASSSAPVFSGQPTTYQLVMGPRMGLIVTPSTPASSSTIQSATNVSAPTPGLAPTRLINAPRVQVRANLGTVIPPPSKRLVNVTAAPKIVVNPATQKNTAPLSKISSSIPAPSTVTTRSKVKLATRASESTPPERPPSTQSPKTATTPAAVVDLTDDDGKLIADSREVSFNKLQNRIYPSLVVVARPNIKVKDMTSAMITAERTQLDTKVKSILGYSPTKFTEWLIQQGLVRSEQVCSSHVSVDMTPIKLKLGMYSDVSKFPYSGGYVWISDCCPQKFVSVFCNSIFEGAPHAPTVLLKLIYHWSCQTNVHNIISWVKVDNLYIKNFFTNLRAICTAAICEKFGKMGGLGKKIEVGVISLGTTSQNGSVRQVKVEVLGVMDPVTKFVRLRAVDPVQNAEKNHKLRFSRILESLEQWVDKRTTIVTDFTVDKATLNDLGFHSVHQVQLNSNLSKDNNQAVMEYLKRVVPRMFQNTLSLLSRSIIQQFLDELVWRERWGPISSRAFDNLIIHLSEITKLDTGDTLINRLKSITANPFKDWSFKNWKTNCSSMAATKKSSIAEDIDTHVKNLAQKNIMALRPKSLGAAGSSKTISYGKIKSASVLTTNADDATNDIPPVPSIDNLPPSITEIDDDNVSISSNSSRRSRTRGATNDASNSAAAGKPWDPQLVLKSLESFYYGTLPPDIVVINKLRQIELNMKCFTCGHTYNNNILFMKHLAGHAQNEGAFTTDYQCRYCFKNFTTDFDLEDHLGSVHFPNKFNSMCLICGDRFKYRGALVTHMQTTHVELELPYQCTICKFRASEHTKLVDHFYEVHNGGEKVQCPYCLKVVAFESSNKTKLTQNVNFYFNHIKRHQKKPIRKCPKCVLTFVNKTLLKEHLTKDHNSCVNIPGIIRHQGSDLSTVLMPLPSVAPPITRKGKPAQSFPVPNFSTYKLDNVLVYPDVPAGRCLECKTEVTPSNHFTSYMTCMKCMFASCCKVVMSKHVDKMHEVKGKRKNAVKRKIPLEKALFCVCGFSSSDGNALASHLVHCKRRIAYPNPERAAQCSVQMQSASFPPLVNLDDAEQDSNDASNRWLRAFVKQPENDDVKCKKKAICEKSPPRMLKELGLVCKESSGAENGSPTDKVKLPEKDDDSVSLKKNDQPKSTYNKDDRQNETKTDDVIQIDEEIMELSDDTNSEKDTTEIPDDQVVVENNDKTEPTKTKVPEDNQIDENVDEVQIAVSALEKEIESEDNVNTDLPKTVVCAEDKRVTESTNLVETDASEINKNGNEDIMDTEERSPSLEKMDEQEENNTAMECEDDNVDEANKMTVDTESTQDVMVVD